MDYDEVEAGSDAEVAAGGAAPTEGTGVPGSTTRVAGGTAAQAAVEIEGDGEAEAVNVAVEELEHNIHEKLAEVPPEIWASLNAERRLAFWYSWIGVNKADAVEELGGNDSCWVSAESLILRFVAGKEFGGKTVESVQFLHIQFALEKFLATLNDIGIVRITIIFFDCLRGLLADYHPALWAFRENFRVYCGLHSAQLPSAQFESWFDAAYTAFVESRYPFVFFLEDGSSLLPKQSALFEEPEERTDIDNGLAPLYSLMLDTCTRGVNVATLYHLAKSGRRLKCFVALPSAGVPDLLEATREEVEIAMKESFEKYEGMEPDDVALLGNASFPPRTRVLLSCAKEVLGEDLEPWAVLFFKAVLLHDLMLRTTPIEERPLSLARLDNQTYSNTLQFLFLYMAHFLAKLTPTSLAQDTDSNEVADMIDEKLIRAILFAAEHHKRNSGVSSVGAEFFGIPDTWVKFLDEAWNEIVPDETGFFPVVLEALDDLEVDELFGEHAVETIGAEAQPPRVLPVKNNDYLQQMVDPHLMSLLQETSVSTEDGERRVLQFMALEGAYPARALGDEEDRPSTAGSQAEGFTGAGHRWIRVCDYDVAKAHIKSVYKARERALPRWVEKKTGDERERAIKRFKLQQEQNAKLFARNINKYFGGLDRLHLPIVMVGGRATADHPWVVQQPSALTDEVGSVGVKKADKAIKSPKTEKPKKEEKAQKVSTKAAKIIAANQEKLAEKQKIKEDSVSTHLYAAMNHMFQTKTSWPGRFHDAFLELLVGSRNAMDTTVLESFGAIEKVLTIPETQVQFLIAVAERLMGPLEHTWTKRYILQHNQVQQLLRLMGLIFRFIHIIVNQHTARMSAADIQVIQTLLLMLGFKHSAEAVFNHWAETQWEQKNKPAVEKDGSAGATAAPKKAGKPGAGQKSSEGIGGKAAAASGDAVKKQKYLTKLATDARVEHTSRAFDFALKPGMEATFQVKHFGPDMERTLGSTVDPRIAFKPDAWQKRMLDAVDAQESALVIAPTASGKTFAAYYAMDKVLRFDNSSCVIFISPTRALALQVESEVIARFSGKTYPATSKTVLNGNLLEDREDNWATCQILITVPSCLEAVLCSTDSKIKQWTQRVKYCILDEIHCIGQELTGRAWEYLIQLLPCPFVALSATVGNADDFHQWLDKAQSVLPPRPVRFIKHDERYADLQTLYYSSSVHGLYPLNPIMCLDFERVKSGALSGDFALTPVDALEAYRQLVITVQEKQAHLDPDLKAEGKFFVDYYDPEVFFKGSRAITKKQYRYFLHSLLAYTERFARQGILDAPQFEALVNRVSAAKPMGLSPVEPWWKDAPPLEIDNGAEPSLNEALGLADQTNMVLDDPTEFLQLVRDLEKRKLMPALVFNFNRAFVSRLFYRTAGRLIGDHHNKFYGTPEATQQTKAVNKKRQDEYKAMLAKREMAEKWRTLSKQQREEQGIDEQTFAELTGPLPPPPIDIAEEHDPEFFLVDRKIYLSMQEEFEGVINMCWLRKLVADNRVSELMLEALRRGIGLYHEALHREYRRAVELLFRMRYLRICLSDSSLSLGINMPCKSTIFAGDYPLLTPLLYRQTAGRAGRRGFDSLGCIIFWEFPFKKIRRLLCSKLTMLSGAYSAVSAMVLRSMVLAENVETEYISEFLASRNFDRTGTLPELDAATVMKIDHSRRKMQKIFTEPLFAAGATKDTRKYLMPNAKLSYRFEVDLLRRVGLLDGNGHADLFSHLVSALGNEENASILLVHCLLSGVLRGRQPPASVGNEISIDLLTLHLLAFAIQRRDYNYCIVRRLELATSVPALAESLVPSRRLPSVFGGENYSPLLPPMPSNVESVVKDLDRMVMDCAINRCHAMSLAAGPRTKAEAQLLMSGVYFGKEAENPLDKESRWHQWTKAASMPAAVAVHQSPLAAIAGWVPSSESTTPEELILVVRDPVFVERGLMPQLLGNRAEVPTSDGRKTVPLVNSYAAELLTYGKLRNVIEGNDIPATEAYFLVQGINTAIGRMANLLCAHTVHDTSLEGKITSPMNTIGLIQGAGAVASQVYAAVRKFAV